MNTWEAAFNCVRLRSVDELIKSIGVDTPFEFDPTQDTSDVADFVEANWEDFGKEHNTIASLPARDMNLVRDTLICATKFFHIVHNVRTHVAGGSMTWAVVDTYHAALLGTRLISALYGVLSYGIQGRTVLIDFRPEFGREDQQKAFRKENKNVEDPVRILRPQPKQLSQSDAWSLINRLCNVTSCPPDEEASVDAMRRVVGEKNSAFRNMIFYDSVAWGWLDDFSATAAEIGMQHQRLEETGASHSTTVNALIEVFSFVKPRLIALCGQCGVQPEAVSPILARDPSPVDLLG